MDARIDPLDETSHHEIVDLLRRADFTEAVVLFARLAQLAYRQGQIDAYAATIERVRLGPLEEEMRREQ